MDIPGIIPIRDDNHMWPASANAYLFPDSRGASLLDIGCGNEERYGLVIDSLSEAGFDITDIHTVVLSHAHPDHMGAMAFLLEDINPGIVIHEIERPLAREPQLLNRTFDMALAVEYYPDDTRRL